MWREWRSLHRVHAITSGTVVPWCCAVPSDCGSNQITWVRVTSLRVFGSLGDIVQKYAIPEGRQPTRPEQIVSPYAEATWRARNSV